MMIVLRKSFKFVLPAAIIAIAVLSARLISANRPEPEIRASGVSLAAVEATRLSSTSYPVIVNSQGTAQPTLANTLVPAVAGTVLQLDDDFVVGGAFRKGDVLLQIDPRDYQIALTQARANQAQADARLQEQQALAEQARAEWRSMGRSGQPSSLTLREPQLAAAKADLDAALAQVKQAELELQRTNVVAPYDGIVSERQVDAGQFVARGAPVGSIHSVQSMDVRLPLTNRQLTWLDLPGEASTRLPNVELSATIGAREQRWAGQLVRTEGIDADTQQLNVIARIDDPYTQGASPLREGQFVQARIEAAMLQNVFVIPRSALREEREVLLIDDNNQIQRQAVTIAWSDETLVAINEGLNEGDLLVVTPMNTVSNGTPVRATIDGVEPAALES